MDNNGDVKYKDRKGHSTFWTIIIVVLFVASALCWLKSVILGVVLAIIAGVVFGITYRGNKREEIRHESDFDN